MAAPFLRLRQICLVATDLAREAARIKAELGLEECYRDANVAKYGLENVLFPVGTNFIEIVSPTRAGTTAGRFLERHGARSGGAPGYMVILDCDDPARWQARAQSLSVRVANVIRHDNYFGVQLHPKDTGAAMLEFNSTAGGRDPMGPYAPAGPNWQKAIRKDKTRALTAVEIESPEPARLAARWGAILDRPVQELGGGKSRIALDSGAIHVVKAPGPEAVFAGVELEGAKPATVQLCGVRFQLRANQYDRY